MDTIKPLSDVIKAEGYTLTQVCRGPTYAVYRVTNAEGIVMSYETHCVRVTKVRGNRLKSDKYAGYTHCEIIASSSEFGRYAWCYPTEQQAVGSHIIV